MLGLRSLLIASTAAALALPAVAGASTYCVENPACNGLDTTFAGALADAAATPANDRIEIGPVTLPPASYAYAPAIDAGVLQIVGSGPSQTVLQNQPASDLPALTVLRGPGDNPLSIASLGVRLTTSGDTFARGIRTAAFVEDVAVTTAGAVAGPMVGVDMLTDGVLRDSSVALQSSGGDAKQRVGVFASETGVAIEEVRVDAPRGIFAQSDVRIRRAKVLARGGSAVSACGSNLRIDNSLVRFQGVGPGIETVASCMGDTTSSTEIRQVTLRGDGSAGSTGIGCASYGADAPAPILVRGTIVDGADDDFRLQTGAAKGVVHGARRELPPRRRRRHEGRHRDDDADQPGREHDRRARLRQPGDRRLPPEAGLLDDRRRPARGDRPERGVHCRPARQAAQRERERAWLRPARYGCVRVPAAGARPVERRRSRAARAR